MVYTANQCLAAFRAEAWGDGLALFLSKASPSSLGKVFFHNRPVSEFLVRLAAVKRSIGFQQQMRPS